MDKKYKLYTANQIRNLIAENDVDFVNKISGIKFILVRYDGYFKRMTFRYILEGKILYRQYTAKECFDNLIHADGRVCGVEE